MKLYIVILLFVGLQFSCSRKESVETYRAVIPFTAVRSIYIHILEDRFIFRESGMNGQVIQIGHIANCKGMRCFKDDISGEVYFFKKNEQTLTFLSGRYKDLLFIKENFVPNESSMDAHRNIFSGIQKILDRHTILINERNINNEFRIDFQNEYTFSNKDSTLNIYLEPDSTYMFYRFRYIIDMGRYSEHNSTISFYSEPLLSELVPYGEWDSYNSFIRTTYKAFMVSDSSMIMGTLPYSLNGDTLKLRKKVRIEHPDTTFIDD